MRNTNTGGAWIISTDGSGRFRIPLLLPGQYELRVSALDFANFGDSIVENIQLAVGQDRPTAESDQTVLRHGSTAKREW